MTVGVGSLSHVKELASEDGTSIRCDGVYESSDFVTAWLALDLPSKEGGSCSTVGNSGCGATKTLVAKFEYYATEVLRVAP